MSKYPKICKGCPCLHPQYGNKDKSGKRTISGYFCSARYGEKINPGLKQCDKRKEKNNAKPKENL